MTQRAKLTQLTKYSNNSVFLKIIIGYLYTRAYFNKVKPSDHIYSYLIRKTSFTTLVVQTTILF